MRLHAVLQFLDGLCQLELFRLEALNVSVKAVERRLVAVLLGLLRGFFKEAQRPFAFALEIRQVLADLGEAIAFALDHAFHLSDRVPEVRVAFAQIHGFDLEGVLDTAHRARELGFRGPLDSESGSDPPEQKEVPDALCH